MIENKNKSVYSFLGYEIINVKFNRKTNSKIEYFKIKTHDRNYIPPLFSFNIVIELGFENEEPSFFEFHSKFLINDPVWKESLNDNLVESIFMGAVFPYIRQKIAILTDDSRGCIHLPIIDLRNVVLNNGIKLYPYNS